MMKKLELTLLATFAILSQAVCIFCLIDDIQAWTEYVVIGTAFTAFRFVADLVIFIYLSIARYKFHNQLKSLR